MTHAWIAALMLVQLPTPATPIAWERIAQDDDGYYDYDPASISRDGPVVRFHLRATPLVPPPAGGPHLLILRWVIHCQLGTSGIQAGDSYGADGARTGTREVRPEEVEMVPIRATSAEALMRARLC